MYNLCICHNEYCYVSGVWRWLFGFYFRIILSGPDKVWDKMIPPCSGVCKSFISPVDCDLNPLLCSVYRLRDTQIPEIILVLVAAGMYSMCYSSSTREVERVLNISRSPQDYILWKAQTCFSFVCVSLEVVSLVSSCWILFLHAAVELAS